MARQRKSNTREFKLETVRLLETSGRGVRELERELGIGAGCLGRWRRALLEEGEHAFSGQGHVSQEEERVRALEREVSILRQDRDILSKSSGHPLAPKKMRYQLVHAHRGAFPIGRMCQVLGVSSSGY